SFGNFSKSIQSKPAISWLLFQLLRAPRLLSHLFYGFKSLLFRQLLEIHPIEARDFLAFVSVAQSTPTFVTPFFK
ncbi:hypothetical protein, partial [Enterococcus sp.]|uniref:hypothetical protein n=1 Tax=Enterococcus sp. TaxID=35783 RepID=UPI002FCABEA6